ncbi:hypothetical protein BATDEDRAFT_27925 [Batrachochytrium dendrobatidis JAM81]|uniref:mannan endo-1,4-beta-mannosidase n=2 Tax=Batrachochytrium dendrobatidis TaxID=109871 RepID=F4PC89_BATDJ|nr:uncharacterized protein BATDEDRAFT_27925 [Batrachochytrium dendrobatidis JAM81]EGF77242.1 hypothetical protein BATDEDRAFT_27925 [Batrachochytrium dendrobatidis JAM81]OAJ44693.1 hypothetical protein BDEG_27899 [Batrachochytrium dendrobatidis JEL423]|eukprot:XP_006682195.1 hypothetical protein BATDEDRAFT_27925 [Batrachochytrium dendrobatidis JAM81]
MSTAFVSRSGHRLIDPVDASPLRFVSFNIPSLTVIEDSPIGWGRPDSFEQYDALESIRQLGGRVARTYTLSIPSLSNDTSRHIIPKANYGTPNVTWVLNEDMFKSLDSAIATAGRLGIYLIIPFIDNWEFWGGKLSFAAMYGSTNFFNDDVVMNGFRLLIATVLNRNNTITGVPYSQDPHILAWETGNELSLDASTAVPAAWTLNITHYIKSIDANHLVMDGSFGIYGWDAQLLASSSPVDIFSNHYYPLPALLLLQKLPMYIIIILISLGVLSIISLIIAALMWFRPAFFGNVLIHPQQTLSLSVADPESLRDTRPDTLFQPYKQPGDGKQIESNTPSNTSKLDRSRRQKVAVCLMLVLTFVFIGSLVSILTTQLLSNFYASRLQADSSLITSHEKAFIVGEFGLAQPNSIQSFIDALISSSSVGALCWSLRPHARNGGYLSLDTHAENIGYWSYHYPGFPSNAQNGFSSDEIPLMNIMKTAAVRMSSITGYTHPTVKKPDPPLLLSSKITTKSLDIIWRGSPGARTYTVQQSVDNISTTFQTIASGVMDNVSAGSVILSVPVQNLTYSTPMIRVLAENDAGISDYSNSLVSISS